ncbi:efflux RND transporter periplasmic adaptor subunit [Desulfatitalea tepidiphila]|uniref:efflux RND transporter periplasmic adaptor subunit n=1 Tax=Desulfatitalea tepidiphila TaxID=1185843 RepID=UPI0006B499DC|nr:efflux RND transporter periplasmic adaptor subunit [Desulfatitalea tepidiphila]
MNCIKWLPHGVLFPKAVCLSFAFGLFVGVLAGCDDPKDRQTSVMAAEVTVMTLAPKNVPLAPEFVAQVRSSHHVDVVARVSGFLDRIAYREGSLVNPGDVLFEIDPKPLKVQLDAEKAELARTRAEHWIARVELDRIGPLAERNAVSRSDLDNATSRLRIADAMVDRARARVEKAALDLGYATIRSPIRGVAGEALVREGAFLTAGSPDARLTSVTRMDPIWVEFSVTQNQYLGMRDQSKRGKVVSPDMSDFEVEVEFSDGQIYAPKGRFSFAEPTFNQNTGTFQVRVELPNPDGALVPGMAVRVNVKGAFRPNAIVIPQRAVQQTANGHMVYVVNDQNVAEVRPVAMGAWIGQDWVADEGLKAGDRLIVDGFQRLAPGALVKVSEMEASVQTAVPAESN